MPTTTITRFAVTAIEHPDCQACDDRADRAMIWARITGSKGATDAITHVDGTSHSATVARVD